MVMTGNPVCTRASVLPFLNIRHRIAVMYTALVSMIKIKCRNQRMLREEDNSEGYTFPGQVVWWIQKTEENSYANCASFKKKC